MAPSPELGQPKAPDKGDTKLNNNEGPTESAAHHRDHSSFSRTAVTSSQQDSKHFDIMEESDLKALLEEAITYKGPRDREHKSATFNELLIKTELEDQQQNFSFCGRPEQTKRASGRHTQGGSLQDLQEAFQNEYHTEFGLQTKKHHNSRQKKYATSVSTRQREGGSLPSNVNESTSAYLNGPYDQPFLNEVNKRKTKNKIDYSTINLTTSLSCGGDILSNHNNGIRDESQLFDGCKLGAGHTIIDMEELESDETQHLLAHDSLAQSISDPLSGDEGIEMDIKIPRIPLNFTSHAKLEIGEPSTTVRPSVHHVDKTVSLPQLESGNKNVDITPVQLGSSYNAVKCFVDNKSDLQTKQLPVLMQNAKFLTASSFNQILTQKYLDENGNSVQTFNATLPSSSQSNNKPKNKKPKSDRNTVLVIPENIAGYRGKDADIESLVCYIENKDKNRKNGTVMKINNNNNNSSNTKMPVADEKSRKKNEKNKKEKNGKLKKCNSLEELSSCSRNNEDEEEEESNSPIPEETVTLRTKSVNKKNSNVATDSTINTPDDPKLPNSNKRGERRSWGTEELNYLGENNTFMEPTSSSVKDKLRIKDITVTNAVVQPDHSNHRNKDSLSIVSIESISTGSETAEFHVVTKKKKPKKRSPTLLGEDLHQSVTINSNNKFNNNEMNANGNGRRNNYSSNNSNRNTHSNSKYQSSNNFANDRDVYMNSFNNMGTDNSRRKSTSSVPPSEKSDSSDLDSVHSLPIESSSSKQSSKPTSTSSGSTPQASYADIARIDKNNGMNNTQGGDKWPSVSNKSSESPDNSNMSTCSTLSGKSQSSTRTVKSSFPELVDHHHHPQNIHINNNNNINSVSNINNNNNNNNVSSSSGSSSSSSNTNTNTNNYNNVIVKQITYSQSLAEDNQNVVLSNNSEYKKSTNNKLLNSEQNKNESVNNNNNNNKLALQKSKSVDNETYYSIEQYPALENTIKAQKPPILVSSGGGADAIKSSKIIPSMTVINSCKKSKNIRKENTTITSNESLESINNNKNNNNETFDSINNNLIIVKESKLPATPLLPRILSEPLVPVNNISAGNRLLQHYQQSTPKSSGSTITFIQTTLASSLTTTTTTTTTPAVAAASAPATTTPTSAPAAPTPAMGKRCKKEKSPSPSIPNSSVAVNHHPNQTNRPAVIILNDNEPKSHEFTFGFDIDQELLFGDFNEDELNMLDDNKHYSNHNSNINESSTNTSTHSDLGYNSVSTSITNNSINATEFYENNSSRTVTESADLAINSNDIIQPPLQQHQPQPQQHQHQPPQHHHHQNQHPHPHQHPQHQRQNQHQHQQNDRQQDIKSTSSTAIPVRDKIKEINVRYIAPEPVLTNYNHDKIVNFVGLAWEDIICGANGGAKYYVYDGQ